MKTPILQNWIHRRTAIKQSTIDGAAEKNYPVLPKTIIKCTKYIIFPITQVKSDRKCSKKQFSKTFDSERNIHHQRLLCNKIRRLPNETIKQLAVKTKTLNKKHFLYMKKKELMVTLTPQEQKAIKKKASHHSSFLETNFELEFNIKQAETTMELEGTENYSTRNYNYVTYKQSTDL